MNDIATQCGYDPEGWRACVYYILFDQESGPDIDVICNASHHYPPTVRKLGDYVIRVVRKKIDSGELTFPARVSA